MRIVMLVGAAMLVGLLAVSSQDQVAAQNHQNAAGNNARQGSQSQTDGQWKNPDHCFATCVAYGNQIEVATAKIASQKSQNPEVKKFAEMMIHYHEQFLKKLEKFAPDAARNDSLASSSGRRGETQATRPGNQSVIQQTAGTQDRDRQDTQHHVKVAQIERELAEKCLASARQKLESNSGKDFDKCFMHAQVFAHEAMKDKLMVFREHASQDLSSILADGLKTTEQHLAKAEEIAKSLDH